jgi:hypothetical protein
LWWWELDDYDGPAIDPCWSSLGDPTRYTCDRCEGSGKEKTDE